MVCSLGKTIQFTNCRLIRYGKIIKDDLWVRNGKIINPEPVFYEEKLKAGIIIDCNDMLVAPGGYGYDFSSHIEDLDQAVCTVAKEILTSGVTSICPTIISSSPSFYHKALPRIRKTPGGKHGASILGVHLEGPFINKLKKGAHPEMNIQEFDQGLKTLDIVYGSLENVCIVTLAPELKGAQEAIVFLKHSGIVVSLGHSNGNLEDGENAINNGASLITHLFNAMLPFHHRDPGLVGLLASNYVKQPVYYGIISDGIHTHPAALRIAYHTNPNGIVLVTDAIAAMGLGSGTHSIGDLQVEISGKHAYLVGTTTLAGSIVTMDECIRRFIKEADVGIVEAIESATLHPAQALGIESQKGTLNFGADADFVFLDDSCNSIKICHTFINGECVNSAKNGKLFRSINV